MADPDEVGRLKERLYEIAERQHTAGLMIERAAVNIEHYKDKTDQILTAVKEAGQRLHDHSNAIAEIRGDVRVLHERTSKTEQSRTGTMAALTALGTGIGAGLAWLFGGGGHK